MNRFLFFWSARNLGEACFELAILRTKPGGRDTEIYLLHRPDSDPFWPGMLHMPGCRKLPDDIDEDQMRRVIKETDLNINYRNIQYLASTTIKTKRGTNYADIRCVYVNYSLQDKDFYDIKNLPDNTIRHHKVFIEMVRKCLDL